MYELSLKLDKFLSDQVPVQVQANQVGASTKVSDVQIKAIEKWLVDFLPDD